MSLFGLTQQQVRSNARFQNRANASQFGGWGMLGNKLGSLFGLKDEGQERAQKQEKIYGIREQVISQEGFKQLQPQEKIKVLANAYLNAGEMQIASGIMTQGQQMLGDQAKPVDQQKQINTLRKDISYYTKDMRLIDTAYTKIKRVAKEKTATGDMSMVFGIMKLNDPGSTVREGEYATAKNAGGVSDRLRNLYNNAIDGQLLQPNERRNFLVTADNLYQAQRESTDRSIEQVLEFADED